MSNYSVIIPDIHGDYFIAEKIIASARREYVSRFGGDKKDISSAIQVGDFGIGAKSNFKSQYKWSLEDINCFAIHGNHEYFDKFDKYKPCSIGGPWRLLPAGSLKGKVLFIGGANSVDADYRKKHGLPWFPAEEIDEKEKKIVRNVIANNDIEVVISHDCPSSFNMSYACMPQFGGEDKGDSCRVFLQEVLEEAKPSRWYFGHWHKKGYGKELGCNWRCLGIPFDYEVVKLPLGE